VNKQLEMINWYIHKRLFVQAITLAREWIVSFVIAEINGDLFDETTRAFAESAINGFSRLKNGRPVPPEMIRVADKPRIKQLWQDMRDLRNDIGHTGMRLNPRPAGVVESLVTNVCGQLPQLLAESSPRTQTIDE
jgi:hypothetical protein